MSILSADDIIQAEHYTKQTLVKRWLIFMLYTLLKALCLATLIFTLFQDPHKFRLHLEEMMLARQEAERLDCDKDLKH